MAFLYDVEQLIEQQTSLPAAGTVLLVTSPEGVPRFRMKNVDHHALFESAGGLFLASLVPNHGTELYSAAATGGMTVGEPMRIDRPQELVVESNWPSGRVVIDGREFGVPRNYVGPLGRLIERVGQRPRRRK